MTQQELVEHGDVVAAITGKTIPIAEIFGPTIQGEGVLAGRPTYFVRVGGCDFSCLWCDTAHAVLAENVRQLPRLSQSQITTQLLQLAEAYPGPDWVAISGGNPGLYDLRQVVDDWHGSKRGRKVTVETQGSRWQPWMWDVDALTVSPKPPSSGMTNPGLEGFLSAAAGYGQHVLKCICFDDADYAFARDLHERYPKVPFYLSTGTAMGGLSGRWIPPAIPDLREGEWDQFRTIRESPGANWTRAVYIDTKQNLLRRYQWLVEKMMNDPAMSDVAVFPQIHALVWGISTRGV